MAELKPCPFCGREAMYVELYANGKTGESSGYVRCSRPIPCVAQSNVRSKKTVYKKWNRRTDNSAAKNGRWAQDGDWMICLNCESEINIRNSLGVVNKRNYCPNCGVKMDGGDGHDKNT